MQQSMDMINRQVASSAVQDQQPGATVDSSILQQRSVNNIGWVQEDNDHSQIINLQKIETDEPEEIQKPPQSSDLP